MSEQILTMIICGGLFLGAATIIVVFGSWYRIKLANQISKGTKDGRFKNFSNPQTNRKIRIYYILSAISILAIFVLLIILYNGEQLHIQGWIIGSLFLLFLIIGALSGYLSFREVLLQLKK